MNLRYEYLWLSTLQRWRGDSKFPEKVDEEVIKCKRRIRKELRKRNEPKRINASTVIREYGDYDSVTQLIHLPDWISNAGEASEYCDEWLWIHAYPSQYDCTGQWFTCWFKVFQRRGQWMAYHRIGIDV